MNEWDSGKWENINAFESITFGLQISALGFMTHFLQILNMDGSFFGDLCPYICDGFCNVIDSSKHLVY